MVDGFLGSFVAKIIYSVACSVGLFGGLAVTGVLPVIGNNASDTVVVDTIAVVETEEQEILVNPAVEMTGLGGIASQLEVTDRLVTTLPEMDGIVSNGMGGGSALPGLGLAETLLNSVTGTLDALVGWVPVVNRAVPDVPVASRIGAPSSPSSATDLDALSGILHTAQSTVRSSTAPVTGGVNGNLDTLPLAGELLRTAEGALSSLLPGLLVIVG